MRRAPNAIAAAVGILAAGWLILVAGVATRAFAAADDLIGYAIYSCPPSGDHLLVTASSWDSESDEDGPPDDDGSDPDVGAPVPIDCNSDIHTLAA